MWTLHDSFRAAKLDRTGPSDSWLAIYYVSMIIIIFFFLFVICSSFSLEAEPIWKQNILLLCRARKNPESQAVKSAAVSLHLKGNKHTMGSCGLPVYLQGMFMMKNLVPVIWVAFDYLERQQKIIVCGRNGVNPISKHLWLSDADILLGQNCNY